MERREGGMKDGEEEGGRDKFYEGRRGKGHAEVLSHVSWFCDVNAVAL